jgi:hypothetical protein
MFLNQPIHYSLIERGNPLFRQIPEKNVFLFAVMAPIRIIPDKINRLIQKGRVSLISLAHSLRFFSKQLNQAFNKPMLYH